MPPNAAYRNTKLVCFDCDAIDLPPETKGERFDGEREATNGLSVFEGLIAGKSPEAIYDALYAGRYLSPRGQESPPEVLALIKTTVRAVRQRALTPATLLKRLVTSLMASGFLNEEGENLASRDAPNGEN
jgi:hypothetical protein